MNSEYFAKMMDSCQWIGGCGNAFCRHVFTATEKIESARLAILADPHSYAIQYWQNNNGDLEAGGWFLGGSFLKYRLFVNGRQIGAGPVRSIKDNVPALQSFDLTADIQPGKNVIGVISRGEKKGFVLCLELKYANGSSKRIISDETWMQLDANDIYRPICWEHQNIGNMFKGTPGPGEWDEHIDGAKFPHGWLNADFDASAWHNAVSSELFSGEFEISDVPNYQLRIVKPVAVKEFSGGYLVDFGKEVFAGIELDAPSGGGEIELRLGEELLIKHGRVRYQMRTGNCYNEIWKFTHNSGPLANFGLRAFRYAEVIGTFSDFGPDKIRAIAVNAPFDWQSSAFECSDKRLEQVWELCKYSIMATTTDVYTDCPARERVVYEADSYNTMLTHFAVENGFATARRTLEYLMRHPTWPCEWRQFMIPLFYEYAMYSGDLEFVAQYYQELYNKSSFFDLIDNGLIRNFPMKTIVDWPESCRDNYEFGDFCGVPNAFLYWDLVLLSELAGFLNKTIDQTEFIRLAGQVKTAFNQKLFDLETGLYIDSENSKHSSFHVNMFALRFGLVPEERIEKCLDFIVRKGMVGSVYAAQFYLDTLFMYKRADEAIALMTSDNESSWLGMIRRGATITTEAWNPGQKANMSWAHPWAASPANVIVRHLLGLRPTAPGWRKYEFNPQPGTISSAQIKIYTPRGTLNAGFKHDNEGQLIKNLTANDGYIHHNQSDLHQVASRKLVLQDF
jgi:alpha-L-rhamnosidase